MAITKEQKKRFAIEFMICQNGFESLSRAGLSSDLSLFMKLCNDKYVNKIIDEFGEYIETAFGRSKTAHVAKLEKLFNQAAGLEDTKIFKFTKDGHFVEKQGKFINFQGAAKLSERLEALNDNWKNGGDNIIDVDLELGGMDEKESEEQEEERNERVFRHFKKEGIL